MSDKIYADTPLSEHKKSAFILFSKPNSSSFCDGFQEDCNIFKQISYQQNMKAILGIYKYLILLENTKTKTN